MRPVSGLDRPALQWLFVALGVALVVVAAGEAVGLRRARGQMEALRAADLSARIERQQLQARATREGSAREALSLEVGRLRANGPGVSQPTLTLSPLLTRGATPPEATVERPAENQVIQLRLVLPARRPPHASVYTVLLRTWSGGETIWSRSGLSLSTVDNRPMVTAFVTGDIFAPGAYEIALTGTSSGNKTEDIAAYEIAVRPPGLAPRQP
jgi:hypothetical protein